MFDLWFWLAALLLISIIVSVTIDYLFKKYQLIIVNICLVVVFIIVVIIKIIVSFILFTSSVLIGAAIVCFMLFLGSSLFRLQIYFYQKEAKSDDYEDDYYDI